MSHENERMHVLEMIESGAINADEGIRLLQDNNPELVVSQPASEGPQAEVNPQEEEVLQGEAIPNYPMPEEAVRWRAWWMVPFWIGVAITVASGGLLYWAVQAAGVGTGFFLALLPFLAGVALMVITWQARSARWLHLGIYQRPGQSPQTIAISFPLPLHLASWFLRVFNGRLPSQMGRFDRASLETLIQSLEQSISANTPFYMEVQGDEDGERVVIYIG